MSGVGGPTGEGAGIDPAFGVDAAQGIDGGVSSLSVGTGSGDVETEGVKELLLQRPRSTGFQSADLESSLSGWSAGDVQQAPGGGTGGGARLPGDVARNLDVTDPSSYAVTERDRGYLRALGQKPPREMDTLLAGMPSQDKVKLTVLAHQVEKEPANAGWASRLAGALDRAMGATPDEPKRPDASTVNRYLGSEEQVRERLRLQVGYDKPVGALHALARDLQSLHASNHPDAKTAASHVEKGLDWLRRTSQDQGGLRPGAVRDLAAGAAGLSGPGAAETKTAVASLLLTRTGATGSEADRDLSRVSELVRSDPAGALAGLKQKGHDVSDVMKRLALYEHSLDASQGLQRTTAMLEGLSGHGVDESVRKAALSGAEKAVDEIADRTRGHIAKGAKLLGLPLKVLGKIPVVGTAIATGAGLGIAWQTDRENEQVGDWAAKVKTAYRTAAHGHPMVGGRGLEEVGPDALDGLKRSETKTTQPEKE